MADTVDHDIPSGAYSRFHKITMYESPENRVMTVTDNLCLAHVSGDVLKFQIDVMADQGHSCWMQGAAHWTGAMLEFRETLQDSYGVLCVLKIQRVGKLLVIEDYEGHCRQSFCGVRAGIGTMRFEIPKPSQRGHRNAKSGDCFDKP